MAIRDGFLIPNANTYAPAFQTSQPDQGDFLILGNSQYGVITGCKISLSSFTVSIGAGPNIFVIKGVTYNLTGSSSLSVSASGTLPRFDLIVFDTDNINPFCVLQGVPSSNPIFPDVTDNMAVFAAVFVSSTGSAYLIDKRNFLQTSVTGVNESSLVTNWNSSASQIKVNIDGNGKVSWGGGTSPVDTSIERTSAGKVKVTSELEATTLTATSAATVNGKKVVTADTIEWGLLSARPTTPSVGHVYTATDTGDISVYKTGGWANVASSTPAGSVICSFLSKSAMLANGWLLLDGSTVLEGNSGSLFDLFPSWRNVAQTNITLPDMRGRFPLGAGASVTPSTSTGASNNNGSTSVSIGVTNLPSHSHSTGATTTGVGGGHSHTITDPQHHHLTSSQSTPIVTSPSGVSGTGQIPLLTPENSDPSNSIWVTEAPGNITGNSSTGISVVATSSHTHSIPHSSVGSNTPITVTPPSIAINFFIKM